MAAVQYPLNANATTPRHGGRRAISVLAVPNPDYSSSDEDTPTYNPYLSATRSYSDARFHPPASNAPPKRSAVPRRHLQLAGTAASIWTPRPRVPSAPSLGRSIPFPRVPDPKSSPKGGRVTPNLPIIEDSDDQSESDVVPPLGANTLQARRTSAPSTHKPPSSPSGHSTIPSHHEPSKRIIIVVTHNTGDYVFIDLTGYADGHVVRERILSKLRIPEYLRPTCTIYRTQLGGGGIGDSLDNNQLLLDCQHLGDDRGSLKFLVQRAEPPINLNCKTSASALTDCNLPGHKNPAAPTKGSNRQTAARHVRQSTSSLSIGGRPLSQHSFSPDTSGHSRSSSLSRVLSNSSPASLDPKKVKPTTLPTWSSSKYDARIETTASASVPALTLLDDDKSLPKVIVEDTSAPIQSDDLALPTEDGSPESYPSIVCTVPASNRTLLILDITLQVDSLAPPGQGVNRPTIATPPTPPPKRDKITRAMTSKEIIQHLVLHGCQDITTDLRMQSCSEFPVASGGFGDVYRGQLGDGTRVAIKCMRIFESSEGEEQQKHLRYAAREIHTWSKLQHPHVLRLLGLANYRNKIAMVSSWMEGGPLRHHLKRTPGANRPQLCAKIADALSYLHQSGIVHGDLKGDNVLVNDVGEPLVTDFGNAVLQERTLNFTFVTTGNHLSSRWAAPELFHGGLRSFETDIYALGMVRN
ncbi:hypothetical protein FRC12_004282 [Ceratobasidium sp. 428]|nr:hypothetical protein FRC12_004282 [Ceratobasidium sp. 428]